MKRSELKILIKEVLSVMMEDETNDPLDEVIKMFDRVKAVAIEQKRNPSRLGIKQHTPEDLDDFLWWDIGVDILTTRHSNFITYAEDTGWTYGEPEQPLDTEAKIVDAIQAIVDDWEMA
jgi:hypothetical protein